MAEKNRDAKSPSGAAPAVAFLGARSPAPTAEEIRDELIAFWDAFSPLSAKGILQAYEGDASLEDIGIAEETAMTFINKYNSLILRGPGKGPLVTTGESRKWVSTAMPKIVKVIEERARP